MKQTGLMFKGELVRAILEGRKTQTRRVVKADWIQSERAPLQTNPGRFHFWCSGEHDCPFGKPGDLIYVRENFYQDGQWCLRTGCEPDDPNGRFWSGSSRILFAADCGGNLPPPMDSMSTWRSRPSIHMPKWAARIWLEITGVRVERLQDISEADAIAEGIERVDDPIGSFRSLWESTGGDWQANPWVWVIDFKRTNKPAAH